MPRGGIPKPLFYDPETGLFQRGGKPTGRITPNGYVRIKIGPKQKMAHHVAWFMTYGVWPHRVDHLNGKRDDNRIANLRLATQEQNMANQTITKRTKSGLRGITQERKTKKWMARVRVGAVTHYLGLFSTKEEAHAAWSVKAQEVWGEFAPLTTRQGS